jgi:hypothetical protein
MQATTIAILLLGAAVVHGADEIDLRPPSQHGRVDRVALALPAADALDALEVVEQPAWSGKKFAFTNRGSERIMLWTYVLSRGGEGTIYASPAELATLQPGKTKVMTLEYRTTPHGLRGEYRLIYAAAWRSKYYKDEQLVELAAAGRAVHAAIYGPQGIEERIRDGRDRYKETRR